MKQCLSLIFTDSLRRISENTPFSFVDRVFSHLLLYDKISIAQIPSVISCIVYAENPVQKS